MNYTTDEIRIIAGYAGGLTERTVDSFFRGTRRTYERTRRRIEEAVRRFEAERKRAA